MDLNLRSHVVIERSLSLRSYSRLLVLAEAIRPVFRASNTRRQTASDQTLCKFHRDLLSLAMFNLMVVQGIKLEIKTCLGIIVRIMTPQVLFLFRLFFLFYIQIFFSAYLGSLDEILEKKKIHSRLCFSCFLMSVWKCLWWRCR